MSPADNLDGLPVKHGAGESDAATLRAALFFAAVVLVTGVRFVDVPLLAGVHTHPFDLIEEQRRWIHSSLINVFAGHALGAWSPTRIGLLYLGSTVLALSTILFYGHRALTDAAQRWTFFRLLALSPLLHVLAFWVDKPDPFLITAYLLCLLVRRPVLVGALSMVMTLAHPEQATAVLVVHVLLQRPRPVLLLAHVLGWAAAIGVHQTYMIQLGVIGSTRVGWVARRLDSLARQNLVRPITMLLLSFSWFWLPVVVYQKHRRGWTLPALACGCFVVAVATADFTRVFTLVSLPLTVHIARELAREGGAELGPWLGRLMVLAFLQMELLSGRVLDNGWALMLLSALGLPPW